MFTARLSRTERGSEDTRVGVRYLVLGECFRVRVCTYRESSLMRGTVLSVTAIIGGGSVVRPSLCASSTESASPTLAQPPNPASCNSCDIAVRPPSAGALRYRKYQSGRRTSVVAYRPGLATQKLWICRAVIAEYPPLPGGSEPRYNGRTGASPAWPAKALPPLLETG